MVTSATQNYQVTITVSNETLEGLSAGGFSLCALKAIATTAGGGQPVLWRVTKQFANSMAIQWSSQVQAYISSTGTSVTVTSSIGIDYGQILSVASGELAGGGLAEAMSILNDTTKQYTCGLSYDSGGQPSPIAAFPLYGNMMDAFAPIEQVLLMFTTYPAVPGQVLLRAYAQGLLIDLTPATERAVSFDINSGWSWGGQPWGQTIPPNTLLTPLLIQLAAL